MKTIKATYTGDLKTEIKSGNSPIVLHTDNSPAAVEKGENYSPVDMLVSSYGACMLSMVAFKGMSSGINIDGASVEMTYEMNPQTHQMTRICADFDFTGLNISDKDQRLVKATAKACPVGMCLKDDIEKVMNFKF